MSFTEEIRTAAARRNEIRNILRANYVGPERAMQASLNEFRHWTPHDVASLFRDFPPLLERRLYPLGPEARYPPSGRRRWAELAAKVATLAVVDTIAVAASPLALATMDAEKRKKTASQLLDMNVNMVSSSLFVAPPLSLMEQAGRVGQALCVNKWGQFRMLSSGYAAISHVWAETMGLEYNNEKVDQDERGLLKTHFNKIMGKALQCGYEWVWLDLLAIPKKSDPSTSGARLTEIKTLIINSLDAVYRNADAVIVLDSLALHLPSADPLVTAAVLVCGMWLTRIWTYQEIKLARKALIVTATHVVAFQDVLSTLESQARQDGHRFHELHRTFARLQSVYGPGINLADIALSCTNRHTKNEVDYARGFYALLGLKWQASWTYQDGIKHIYNSRPQEAAMIASMHGPRGLPSPFTWVPKYLAQLQGKSWKPYYFRCESFGLVGKWHSASVLKLARACLYEQPGTDDKLAFELLIGNNTGETAPVVVVTWSKDYTTDLTKWTELISGGKSRLLCADEIVVGEIFPTVLLGVCEGDIGPEYGLEAGAMGYVLASGVLVSGNMHSVAKTWLLK
ncbi:uncharacterized protein BDW70DRAFT_113363 [Aspergillus foveolatus]|uniref:uncharacterized protein n=1 Tax=Aspergillus foveolatus TaxID=210207 RepID=UPI003CCD36F8